MESKVKSNFTIRSPDDPRPSPSDAKAHLPKPNFDIYQNPWNSWQDPKGFTDFLGAKILGELTNAVIPKDVVAQVGLVKPSFESSSHEKIKAIWLGHACFYLELPSSNPSSRGLRVLTDPVFSDRCSPISFMGPKRYTPVPVKISDLPEIDIICVSHNHYDHLDVDTLPKLVKQFPEVHVFAPLGLKPLFDSIGIPNMTEMDWWQELIFSKSVTSPSGEKIIEEARIGYLPAQHMTMRGLFDKFKTLWGSFSVESVSHPTSKVFFAGDTGRRSIPKNIERGLTSTDQVIREAAINALAKLPVCPAHAQIGELRGPFKFAIIPIGAYKPRFLMSPVHIDPAEAVEIYKELRAENACAIHWGTWQLSSEEIMEPKEELERIVAKEKVTGFKCWKLGEKREF